MDSFVEVNNIKSENITNKGIYIDHNKKYLVLRNIYYIISIICFTLYIDIIMHLLKNKNNDKIYDLIFTVFFISNLLINENSLSQ